MKSLTNPELLEGLEAIASRVRKTHELLEDACNEKDVGRKEFLLTTTSVGLSVLTDQIDYLLRQCEKADNRG